MFRKNSVHVEGPIDGDECLKHRDSKKYLGCFRKKFKKRLNFYGFRVLKVRGQFHRRMFLKRSLSQGFQTASLLAYKWEAFSEG